MPSAKKALFVLRHLLLKIQVQWYRENNVYRDNPTIIKRFVQMRAFFVWFRLRGIKRRSDQKVKNNFEKFNHSFERTVYTANLTFRNSKFMGIG